MNCIELFAHEVMAVIRRKELMRGEPELRQPITHGCDFMVAYILGRPHVQSPWNANSSAMLNTLVDDILRDERLSIETSRRRDSLHALCKAFRQHTDYHSVVPFMFYSLNEKHGYDHWLLSAQIIIGMPVLRDANRRRLVDSNHTYGPYVLGTLLNSAIWGRRYRLMRYILDKPVSPESHEHHGHVHRAIETAIHNDDLEALRILFEYQWMVKEYVWQEDPLQREISLSSQLGHHSVTNFLRDQTRCGELVTQVHAAWLHGP